MTLDPANAVRVVVETQFSGSGSVDLSNVVFTVSADADPSESKSSTLDLVLLKIPSDCINHHEGIPGCDWPSLGIGYRSENAETDTIVEYCCNKQALGDNRCEENNLGRLLIHWTGDNNNFAGQLITLTIPPYDFVNPSSNMILKITEAPFFPVDDPGVYALLFANCNQEYGKHIVVDGVTVWRSVEDEIQTFIGEEVPFFIVMTCLYAILLAWYGYHMRQNKDSRIQLEEWIRIIIILGFTGSCFGIFEYTLLQRQDFGTLARVVLGFGSTLVGIRRGLSRCLLLMLSLGWGVVYPSLHPIKTAIIITLGVLYCLLEAVEDFMFVIGATRNSFLSFCSWASFMLDIVFLFWIPNALFQTMKYLKTSNQTRKLERYRYLFYILVLAVFLTVSLLMLVIWDAAVNFGRIFNLFNLSQGNDINFFLIMTCVACLWKPNPMAREYVYVMELSSQETEMGGPYSGALGMDGREGYLADLEMTENSHDENGTFTIDSNDDNIPAAGESA